jgi:sec-independent protein translocase protein TatA
MLGGLGFGELLMIGGGLLLLFGAKKIPTLARGLGEGIRNFKGELKAPEADRRGSSGSDERPKRLQDGDDR